MVTAIAEYLPQSDDELHFEVGDELFVNLAFADGWGTGMNTRTQASGYFPLTYVTSIVHSAVSTFSLTKTLPTSSRFYSLQHSAVHQTHATAPHDMPTRGAYDCTDYRRTTV
ncbi:hypothetical protein M427DRAFT_259069 [Gonapodya prolifera JEL478]|uniref:SH3 domain-containing protein n=1 Tax=Gonapodya prolifera (strain JEL478) TaxID=1344416 RepID=A0A139AL90_GONPJ|nr:hypothetical protein M427DRAFT_259069 [Gonapodya prolifera JEL478]|eukprot:KXS17294.1 hypothetical protein M427DRAFT_259069 [Gonapodya prolifera JEL478]